MSISLAGKWAKSENTSSRESRVIATETRKKMGLTPKFYRKLLSILRREIDVVERRMSSGDWSGIEYDKVPSVASLRYRKAFKSHDETGYNAFLSAVERGEKKIQAGTLLPHDLVKQAITHSDRTVDAQWAALPDFLKDNPHKGLVMADTSGSMTGSYGVDIVPIHVAIGLALYFAERNVGPFKDVFLSFSGSPEFHKVKGATLRDKIDNAIGTDWGMNTDLHAAFRLILSAAVTNRVPKEDMPEVLYIVSDMEFDSAQRGVTNFDAAKAAFERAGYDLPNIVFWNVSARNEKNQPVTMHQSGAALVSGCSPSVLNYIWGGKVTTPVETMLTVLNSERYEAIAV